LESELSGCEEGKMTKKKAKRRVMKSGLENNHRS